MMSRQTASLSKKGQAATETMVTLGMILVFVIPILLLLLVGAQARFESLSHIQGGSVTRIVSDSINEVYIEGPGASKTVVVNFPSNARYLNITGDEAVMGLDTRSGPTEIVSPFFGELNQSSQGLVALPSGDAPSGLYPIKFYADSSGNVVIEHGG
ncbi:MAG: hypothetical protein ACLFUZ_00590 [Candidatus Micrarchaeia archaeon]